LAYRAPLYGRRTAQWHLQPLTFEDSRLFLPSYSIQDQVRAYAIIGGIPAYLRQLINHKPLLDNVEDQILSQGSFLYDEPRFLLQMELREPRIYFAILEVIATGTVRQAIISKKNGRERCITWLLSQHIARASRRKSAAKMMMRMVDIFVSLFRLVI